jgi:malonyl CoA-acyl carrier protein transacylase
MIEAGPGNVLSGLMRRIERSCSVATIGKAAELEEFKA